MIGHVIGSNPTPYFNSPASETSLVVLQFFAFVTGEAPVYKPDNGFRTVSLVGEERYCLGCCGVRWHDVLEGITDKMEVFGIELGNPSGVHFRIARCRVCEKVGAV